MRPYQTTSIAAHKIAVSASTERLRATIGHGPLLGQKQTYAVHRAPLSAKSGHRFVAVVQPKALATSFASRTKSCAVGLIVRRFNVTTPVGTLAVLSSTGRIFSPARHEENCHAEAERMVRNRPLASMLKRTWATGSLLSRTERQVRSPQKSAPQSTRLRCRLAAVPIVG